MNPPTDRPADPGATGVALRVLAVQGLLALSWTVYVLFLPWMIASVLLVLVAQRVWSRPEQRSRA